MGIIFFFMESTLVNSYYIDKTLIEYRKLIECDVVKYEFLIKQFILDNMEVFASQKGVDVFLQLYTGSKEQEQYYKYDKSSQTIRISTSKEKGYTPILFKYNSRISSIDFALNGTLQLQELGIVKKMSPEGDWIKDTFSLICSNLSDSPSEKGNLIQYVLDKYQKTATFDLWLQEVSFPIFFNLVKSILIGEYIICDRYLELIHKEVFDIQFHPDEIEYRNAISQKLETEFSDIFTNVQSFCSTLKKSIEASISGKNIETIVIDGFFNKRNTNFSHRDIYIPKDWLNIFTAVLNITYIDYIFVTTDDTLRILSQSIQSLQLFESEKISPRAQQNSINRLNAEIIIPLCAKAYVLLKQMICHKPNDDSLGCVDYYFVDDTLDERFNQDYNVKESDNEYIIDLDTKCHHPYTILDKHFKSNKLQQYIYLHQYNSHQYRILKKHQQHKKILDAICNKNKNVIKLVEKYLKSSPAEKLLTASFLYKTIDYLYSQLQESLASDVIKDAVSLHKLQKQYDVVIQLCDELDRCINRNKNCNVDTYQVRDLFHLSCYFIQSNTFTQANIFRDSTYLTSWANEKSAISFLSLGYKPINVLFLSNFLKQSKRGLDELQRKINEREHEITLQKLDETLHHERSHTMQTVGILGAFIAFVSVTATGIHGMTNPNIFTIYLSVITMAVLIFAGILRLLFGRRDTIKCHEWIIFIILILIQMLLLYNVWKLMPDTNDKQKENTTQQDIESKYNNTISNSINITTTVESPINSQSNIDTLSIQDTTKTVSHR